MAVHDIAHDETRSLIASDKVDGTAVYSRDGERLGSIHNFMVDKRTGHVEYAVLSFGGLLGLGTDFYPIPWKSLTYEVARGGYVVDIDKTALKSAPHYSAADEPTYDPTYGRAIYTHYGFDYPLT